MRNYKQVTIVFLVIVFMAHNAFGAILKDHSSLKSIEEKTILYADEIQHDKKYKTITARGHVEIKYENRILWADTVTYNENTDLITASGNVRLNENQGEIIYLDYAELTGDLKEGFVKKIRMSLADHSRLVAKRGRRENETISHLEQAVYSPCNICKTDPEKPPFWQIKAKHVVLDEASEKVFYTDAFMELLGVPVFYTPYFTHPAPHAERKTGLLNISAGYSNDLGLFSIVKYFWAISKDKDMTFMPMIRADGHGILGLEYRQRFEKGKLIFEGSLDPGSTVKNKEGRKLKESNRVRWHFMPKITYDFTPHIRGGLSIERTSDQSYLRRYTQFGYLGRAFLTSNIYGEGFWGRNYGILQGYSFQGLREADKSSTTPLLLPWLNINYLSQPDSWGGRWSVDSDALFLTRQKGTRYGRFSTTGGWQKKFISTRGEDYTWGVKVRGDFYDVNSFRPSGDNTQPVYNANTVRFFPQTYLNWAYPLFHKTKNHRIVLEPVTGIVVAPNQKQHKKIPNEDGNVFEFSDANIMSESRSSGLDVIDVGSRLNYGFNANIFSDQTQNTGFFVGQSIAFQKPGPYLKNSGLDKRVSDIVARIKYNYQDWLTLKSRFLIDRSKGKFYRNETSGSFGKPILRLNAQYEHLPNIQSLENPSSKQLTLVLSSAFHENWKVSLKAICDLIKKADNTLHQKRKHILSQGIELIYTNECFSFSNTLTKSSFNDGRELKPGYIYMFRIYFKNLGEFSQSLGSRGFPGQEARLF